MQTKNKIILFFAIMYLSVLFSFTVKGQSRIVFNDNAVIVINNTAKVVIDNANPNAISYAGGGGSFISEGEFNQVKWNIGTNVGQFSVPLSNIGLGAGTTVNIISAGVGNGSIWFSSYGSTDWQNSTYLPSDVTHFNSMATLTDNSANAIDRFWIVDAMNYTVKPQVELSFWYIESEVFNPGNSIVESQLKAQRFNSDLQQWGDFDPAGVNWWFSDGVRDIPVNPTDFYRSWTLVDTDGQLPVELADFRFECKNDKTLLKWITFSESNNDFFTIESSYDGIEFVEELMVNGAGNSNTLNEYSIEVVSGKYYKLSQTDFNGMKEDLGIILAQCGESSQLEYWQSMENLQDIKVSGLTKGDLTCMLFDMGGKLVFQTTESVNEGNHLIRTNDLPNGIYTISIKNNDKEIAGKIMMMK